MKLSSAGISGSESEVIRPEVRITEAYSGYKPRFAVESIIQRLLDSVPSRYLNGLSEVVLTNTASLPRYRRRSVTKSRGHKVNAIQALGLYHPAWNGKQAWIELFVDNIFKRWESGWWLWFQFIREMIIHDVLFYEIGHHIHYTHRPEFREREDVADVWKVRLQRNYFRHRHPVFRFLLRLFKPLYGSSLSRWNRKIAGAMFRKGVISRAEYDETLKKSPSLVASVHDQRD